jgi:hypothetical protein
MAARLCEATGLVAEQRAEGLALADETGSLTDVAMPAEGTDAHVTLLVAEYLANRSRGHAVAGADEAGAFTGVPGHEIADFIRQARERYGRYWRSRRGSPAPRANLPILRWNAWKSCSLSSGAQAPSARVRHWRALRSARPMFICLARPATVVPFRRKPHERWNGRACPIF